MKKQAIILYSMFVIFISMNFISSTANSTVNMTVEVDVLKTIASATINSSLDFGTITKGYKSNELRVDVTNTGTTNITIQPELESSDNIFNNLYLRRRTTDSALKIGSFSMNLARPTTMGGIEDDYFYIKLDLTSYTGSITSDIIGHSKKLIIWVLPQE